MRARCFSLQPFPQDEPPSPLELTVSIARVSDILQIQYTLFGRLSELVIPAPAERPERKDGLWEQTCFELFLAPANCPRYWELNLSPAGHWNVYRFAAYRQGMSLESAFTSLPLTVRSQPDSLVLGLEVDLNGIVKADQDLDASITAVLKHSDAKATYWALAHCRSQADFHCRESFVVKLAP